jgi:hypothetical protein
MVYDPPSLRDHIATSGATSSGNLAGLRAFRVGNGANLAHSGRNFAGTQVVGKGAILCGLTGVTTGAARVEVTARIGPIQQFEMLGRLIAHCADLCRYASLRLALKRLVQISDALTEFCSGSHLLVRFLSHIATEWPSRLGRLMQLEISSDSGCCYRLSLVLRFGKS